MKIAIYPGSFDPVTLGHLDIIRRASIMFDRLIVAVMHNQNKKPAFSAEERVEFLKRTTADLPNVEVESFDGLLADYAKQKNACAIVKGLRAVSDDKCGIYVPLFLDREGYCGTRRRCRRFCSRGDYAGHCAPN